MPAIKVIDSLGTTKLTVSHPVAKSGPVVATNFGRAELVGFICTQGTKFLKDAKLSKVFVEAITNGDGREEMDWQLVAPGDGVYSMIIIGNGNPREECYVLVNDEGWPILTGKTPPEYLPPEINYEPNNSPMFGHLLRGISAK